MFPPSAKRPKTTQRDPTWTRWLWSPWIAMVTGLSITLLSSWRLHAWAVESDRSKFDSIAKSMREQLETRMEKYEMGMLLLQSQFHAGLIKSEKDWKFALDLMGIRWNFPGLFEVGYAAYFTDSWVGDPPEVVLKTNWFRVPRHRKVDTNGVEIPGRYLPVILHWPETGDGSMAYGTELYPHDVKKGLTQIAWQTGAIAPSGRKTLSAREGVRPEVGVTFYLPVYEFHKATGTWNGNIAQVGFARDEGQAGFIFFSIAMGRFIESMMGAEQQEVLFEIFSSRKPAVDEWLNPQSKQAPLALAQAREPHLQRLDAMSWYSKPWCIYFHTTPLFQARSPRYRAVACAVLGTVLSLGIFGVLSWQTNVRSRERAAAHLLSESNERLQVAAEERIRLSRDLHDGAIQSVFGLGLGLDYCLRQISKNPEKAVEALCRSKDDLNEVIAELRNMVLALQSNESWRASPREAWEQLLTRLQEISPIPLEVELNQGAVESVTEAANIDLLNIAREGVMNAIRHSQAKRISVHLRTRPDGIELKIQDNGRGFDQNTATAGHGLKNMAARVQELGGALICLSNAGGTAITVRLGAQQKQL